MTAGAARALAWSVFALTVASAATGAALSLSAGSPGGDPVDLVFPLLGLVFGSVGALVASRRAGNPIGWIFVAVGAGLGLLILLGGIEDRLVVAGHATSALARVSAWTEGWTWVPLIFAPTTFPLLLFPDGHLPSRRWRWLVWASAIGMPAFAFSMAFDPDNYDGGPIPIGVEPPRVLVDVLSLGSLLLIAAVIGGGAAIVVRLRRSRGEERQQLKWLAYAGIAGAVTLAAGFLIGGILATVGTEPEPGSATEEVLTALVLVPVFAIPVSMGVAILRYRLYDIDVVIRKTVVFAILVALLMVVAIGGLLALSSPLTDLAPDETQAVGLVGLVVGLSAWPLYRLSRRIADRVVFKGRSSPYEVLTGFGDRMAAAYATDDVLPRLAAVLGEGTGAELATVWLRLGEGLVAKATWPSGAGAPPMVPDDAVEVIHQGERLGALSVRMPANDPMSPGKERIVRDLAGHAGLVLRNVRLIEELKASRQRLVAAQDEERRRIERNIHDGAQQQLVALSVKQRLAASLIGRDDDRARAMLAEIQAETTAALEDLRDLARGIYPPLLADKGLAEALSAQARRSPVPVAVDPDGVGRYPQEVESAVYFSVLEGLQNVAKHADASGVTVRLRSGDGDLSFEIADDGRGFDPAASGYGSGLRGMADRLASIGGELEVASSPGHGTTIRGRIPIGGES
jgi:signal transduction histidine kinase